MDPVVMIIILAVAVIALVVLPAFTNKKRAASVNKLHEAIVPGVNIKTVGGIVGTVISVKEISPVDKEIVLETGVEGSKTTLVMDIQSVYQIVRPIIAVEGDADSSSDVDKVFSDVVTKDLESNSSNEDTAAMATSSEPTATDATTSDDSINTAAAVEPVATKKSASTTKSTSNKATTKSGNTPKKVTKK